MKSTICGLVIISATIHSSGCGETSAPTVPIRQQLIAKGDCAFPACGSLPSNAMGQPKVECEMGSAGDCAWSVPDDKERPVSYRRCDDNQCPARPAINCPTDTVKSSQQCGDDDNTGCAWTTICVPPRLTAPCPQSSGCSGQPVATIAIICSDGSNGDYVCVTDGKRCLWERSCD